MAHKGYRLGSIGRRTQLGKCLFNGPDQSTKALHDSKVSLSAGQQRRVPKHHNILRRRLRAGQLLKAPQRIPPIRSHQHR